MAEAALFEIAGGIITKLTSLPIQQLGLCWSVKDELDKLRMTVSTIQAVLLDAEDKYSNNHQVKNWVNLLKQAFYDADDLLDDFATRSLQAQVMSGRRKMNTVCTFFSSSNQFACALKMASKTKAIRSKLDAIVATKNFHLDERSEEPIVTDLDRESHSSLPQVVVGRDDDKKAIIEFLLASGHRENVSVISIVGLGGLGKTTLAQLVWDDENVKSHFELKLWAWVSDRFDLRQILEKILESVVGKLPENLGMNTLKDKLHETIKEKRYLLVLDDVWNENSEKWFQLKDMLAVGDEGSRIIVTTRQRNIAQMMRSDSIYDLRGLDDSQSWTLFKEMAFEHRQELSPEHEKVGKEIVAKCVGVPLAIRSIGRLLYSKSLSEWLSIKDKQLSDMEDDEISILPILKLSYDHLPSHLKHCFAYCRLFPKGCKIGVPFLLQNWAAQGYIKPLDSNKCLEETSLEYFKNLLWRSFFQEVEEDDFGSIKWCKMHNLIHDLAVFVAGEESCQLDMKGDQLVEGIKAGTRHLWIDFKGASSRQMLHALSNKLRSLYLWDGRETEERDLHVTFSNSKCLRALTLCNMGIDRVPPSIGKLKHLRYLSLAHNTRIRILPNSITQLQNLQVLDLDGCERLKQLPKDIRKLINLTHIYLWGCNSLVNMPHGLGELTSLQHLSGFTLAQDNNISKHCGGLGELRDLNNISGWLRILNLRYVKNPKSVFAAANLKEKQHLRCCYFAWKLGPHSDGDPEDDCDPGDEILSLVELRPHVNLKSLGVFGCGRLEFPSWVSSLFNLVNLDIRNCKNCHLCPPLDQLPFLKSLGLHGLPDMEYMEREISCENKPFFPSLENLWLKNCPSLKGWRRDATRPDLPQFHCLKYLEMDSCPNLTSMPEFPSVEKLVWRNASIKSLEDIVNIKDPALSHAIPLPSLETMVLDGCNDGYDENGRLWQCLTRLQNLQIRNMSKLISLPEGLQHVHNLHGVLIETCPNLMHLPEWISSLQYLEIENCSELSKKCSNNMGADWPKISLIPNIRIEGTWTQYDGCYTL